MPDLKTAMRVAEKSENIQDLFLNNIRRDRALVTLHLLTGAKLTGKIRSFDKFSLILEANHQEQLIFKHAISTVVVARGHGEVREHRAPVAHVAPPPPIPPTGTSGTEE